MAERTAAYWEGWTCFRINQPCKYDLDKQPERTDWALGFAAAVNDDKHSKVWYTSRTMWAGIICLVVGMGMLVYGLNYHTNIAGLPTGQSYGAVGAGASMMATSLIFTALRLVTSQQVGFGMNQPGMAGTYPQ